MKEYTPERIRNVSLIGHGGSGKTSLSEAMLLTAGITNRMGTIADGTTLSDYHSDEIERQISIMATPIHLEWKGDKVNLIDTPGYQDFTGEVKTALRVSDIGVVVLKAVEGVEVGSEIVWGYTEEYKNACIIVVNKLDHENAAFDKAVASAKSRFGGDVTVVQFPVNEGLQFNSVVDVLRMKLLTYTDVGGRYTESEIPPDVKTHADELHQQLLEKVAESDEELLNAFFENGTLSDEQLQKGLRTALVKRAVFPVLCAASTRNIGVASILDFITDYAPSPLAMPEPTAIHANSRAEVRLKCDPKGEPVLFVFKTVSEPHVGDLSFFRVYSGSAAAGMDVVNQSNGKSERLAQIFMTNGKERKDAGTVVAGDIAAVVKLKDTHTNNTLTGRNLSVLLPEVKFPEPLINEAIVPRAKGDEEKMSSGLHALRAEDPTFLVRFEPLLHQTVISGQGELHLTIIVKRLKERYGVEVDMVEPKIPYKETLEGKIEDAEYKHKKQTGGRGQYGHVHLKIEPNPRGTGFEFVDAIVGGAVPGRFIPAVERGVREAMVSGVIAGYEVVDVKVTLHYGSYHPVDSDEMSFKIAGLMGFKKGFKESRPILLEPIYEIEVQVPEENMGDAMGDISSRRGKILGMDSRGPFQVIRALAPLKELYKYSTSLRSMTQGRGIFHQKFDHYEKVPKEIEEEIIADAQKEKEQEK